MTHAFGKPRTSSAKETSIDNDDVETKIRKAPNNRMRWWATATLNISIAFFTYLYMESFTYPVVLVSLSGIVLVVKRRAIRNWYLSVLKADAHVGPGGAMAKAQKESGDIVRVEWFTSKIPGAAGISLGARHSFLLVEVMDCSVASTTSWTPFNSRRVYILEKSAQEDDWNGVRVSDTSHLPKDWKNESSSVGIKLVHCLQRTGIRRERGLTPRLSTLVHRMSATGEYDLGLANCHHAAQVAYNLCVHSEAERIHRIPNRSLIRLAAVLGIGKKHREQTNGKIVSACSRSHSTSVSQSSDSSDSQRDGKDAPMKPGRHQHFHSHDPSTWCITPKQFFDFAELVEQKWPGTQDPNAHQVVREFIKNATAESGLSYALQLNRHGKPIKYFVSQNWAYSTKKLIAAIKKVFLTKGAGNLWICFLANPQWEYEELSELLGDNVWYSPFAKALFEAEAMVVVRDAEFNMYERLWCVLERALAEYWSKPIVVVGESHGSIAPGRMGVHATCTDERDRKKILSMLRTLPLRSPDGTPRSTDEIINTMCMQAVQEEAFEDRHCALQ